MKKKILKIAIIMIMSILVWASIVNAFSLTVTMTPSSTTVAESTEFTVKIKVSNLDVGTNGINTVSGYFKYDKDIFETITDSSIDGCNGWSPTYTADSEKITLYKGTFVKTEEDVFQVTLKTKSGIAGKSGKIEFTQIMAGNSDTEIKAQDISTEITVGNVSDDGSNNNNSISVQPISNNTTRNTNNSNKSTNNAVISNNTGNTNSVRNTNVVNNTENTASNTGVVNNATPDQINYAGAEDTIIYIIAAVIIIAIVFYIKFEKINKEMK